MAVLLLLLAVVPSTGHARFTTPPYDLVLLEKTVDLTPWMDWLPHPERRYTWQSALAGDGWQPPERTQTGLPGLSRLDPRCR